ncbi:hypothetical protein LCGC14_1795620 [marine sediment metagenome]|uniref:Uncharacterized protein n=1 Tax=marine sediment metagenome TaxID=412755 RepID=A0A0F9JQT7_9ZZZZ
MINKPRKYRVGRPINGITINGLEYVLDCLGGDYVLFDTEIDAVSYLVEKTGEPALNIIADFNSGALVLEEDK